MSDQQAKLREEVRELLEGGAAHPALERHAMGIPAELRGVKPAGQSHTAWRLVEHLRIAQHDIVQFIDEPNHHSPPWPDGFWPDGDAPPDHAAWDRSLEQFNADLGRMRELVEDPSTDLLQPMAHAENQTVLREALLLADHNAYHTGQLATLRALLSA